MERISHNRLNTEDLRVFVALASLMKGKNECSPGLPKISKRCGIHPSHIPTHVRHLVEKGYIKKTRRGNQCNIYSRGDALNEATETSDLESIVRNDAAELLEDDHADQPSQILQKEK